MALISCPECGKEVSDQVKSCVHCGYPINVEEDDAQPKPQQVELTSINIGNPQKKKKTIIAIVVGLVAVAVVVAGVLLFQAGQQAKARDAYIDNLNALMYAAIAGGADAEGLGNLTKSVWYNTIYEESDYETDKYTKSSGSFNEDFNDSLNALFFDSTTIETIAEIESNQESVAAIMKTLQNPTDEFEECYSTANDLYEAYQGLTDLATSPTGSLTSYSDNFRTLDDDLMKYYKKLETQIPEKEAATTK